MLRAWSEEPEYQDSAGRPRVLLIEGPQATFESLARRFLPGVSLANVVAMICARADVAIRPRGRIALVGGVLVTLADSPHQVLAQAIRHIDQVLSTLSHNAAVASGVPGEGRTERVLLGVIPGAQFDALMRDLRPQIGAFLERIESAVAARREHAPVVGEEMTTVSVGVCVAREDNWQRAGLDAATCAKASGPTFKRR